MRTPEQIARDTQTAFCGTNPSECRSHTPEDVLEMIQDGIEVYREEIIRDMARQAHRDDWNVPCVYVNVYAKRLIGEE